MNAVELELTITRCTSKNDLSLGVAMSTPRDLSGEEKAIIMELQGYPLICTFRPKEAKDAPVFKIDKQLETKTPSNRLRNVLFVLWEQEGRNGEFDDFYRHYMEKIIEAVKAKLE